VVRFLVSDAARFVNGALIDINGGRSSADGGNPHTRPTKRGKVRKRFRPAGPDSLASFSGPLEKEL